MKKDSKQAVLDMIDKRKTYNRRNRVEEAKKLGARGASIKLMEALDKLKDQINYPKFKINLERTYKTFTTTISYIDTYADINIVWSNEDLLQMQYITIQWTQSYLDDHRDQEDTYIFDVAKYILEEVFFGQD